MANGDGLGALALVAGIFAVAALLDPPAAAPGAGGVFGDGCTAAGGDPERHGSLRLCRVPPAINLSLDGRNLDADLGRPGPPSVRVTGRTRDLDPVRSSVATVQGPYPGLQVNLELAEVAMANPKPLAEGSRTTPGDLRFGEACDLAGGTYTVDTVGGEHCQCGNGIELYWTPPGLPFGPELIVHYRAPGGARVSVVGGAPGGGQAIGFRQGMTPGVPSETVWHLGSSLLQLSSTSPAAAR